MLFSIYSFPLITHEKCHGLCLETQHSLLPFIFQFQIYIFKNLKSQFKTKEVEIWNLKAGPWTSNISIIWKFIRNIIFLPTSDLLNQKLHFYKILRWFTSTLNFKQLKLNYSKPCFCSKFWKYKNILKIISMLLFQQQLTLQIF